MPAGLKDSIEWVGGDSAGMVAARNIYIAIVAPARQESYVSMQLDASSAQQQPSADLVAPVNINWAVRGRTNKSSSKMLSAEIV